MDQVKKVSVEVEIGTKIAVYVRKVCTCAKRAKVFFIHYLYFLLTKIKLYWQIKLSTTKSQNRRHGFCLGFNVGLVGDIPLCVTSRSSLHFFYFLKLHQLHEDNILRGQEGDEGVGKPMVRESIIDDEGIDEGIMLLVRK